MAISESPEQSVDLIKGYHAHVYYDAATKPVADRLREAVAARFDVRLGRWHDDPIGPHPPPAAIRLNSPLTSLAIWCRGWRSTTRASRCSTGNAIADHSAHVLWLGGSRELNLTALR